MPPEEGPRNLYISTFDLDMAKVFLYFVLGFVLSAAAAESVLRFLPVNSGWNNAIPSKDNPLIRFIPLHDFTYSRGWKFDNVIQGTSNNYGYISRHNYDPNKKTIVVIGDSFTEAAMIPGGQRVHEILHGNYSPDIQVASLGISGADLADYLVAARFAVQNFKVESIIFLLNSGDFSGAAKPKIRGFWFARNNNGEIAIKSAANIKLRNAFYSSSLLSYLYGNLKFSPGDFLRQITTPNNIKADESALQPVTPPQDRLKIDSAYLNFFLTSLRNLAKSSGLSEASLYFAFDGDRNAVYSGKPDLLTERYDKLIDSSGYKFSQVTLTDCFRDDYSRRRKAFDFGKVDSHWNSNGHQVVADCLMTKLKSRQSTYLAHAHTERKTMQ
jgi:hypothetical protein